MKCKQIKEYLDKVSGLEISTPSREDIYIKYRCMYYFLCQKYSSDGISYNRIANPINKDHASLLHGLKTFESFMISDPTFREDFAEIESYVVSKLSVKNKARMKSIDSMDNEKLRGNLLRLKNMNDKSRNQIFKLKKKVEKKDKIINKLIS